MWVAPGETRMAERLVICCRKTSVSAAHATHCATYCTPFRPLIRAFSGWIRTPPSTGCHTPSHYSIQELPPPIGVISDSRVAPTFKSCSNLPQLAYSIFPQGPRMKSSTSTGEVSGRGSPATEDQPPVFRSSHLTSSNSPQVNPPRVIGAVWCLS